MVAVRTSLLVPVPEAEPVVSSRRWALDHTASWGIPAHVTVLYPFVPPDQVTSEVLEQLAEIAGAMSAFECVFDRVAWFGDQVVWLAPAADRGFRELTRAVWDRFPDHPPYRGAIDDPTPHLTIGDTHLADLPALRRAAVEIEPLLPFTARLDRVALMAGTEQAGSWRTLAEIPLG